MILKTNVKINLGLNVLRKRPDGYHDLDTVFVPCSDFGDTLVVEPAERFSITIEKEGGCPWDPMSDLCVRAYDLMKEEFDLPPVAIYLEKTSPVGAGLGGGSADAAFTLRALDSLFELGLGDEALAARAARLGSDCAFFIYNRPMRGSGRGEILEEFNLPALEDYRIKLYVPEGIAVSTADAYRGITPRVPELSLAEALSRPVGQWRDCVVNDFETTVFAKFPQLAALKDKIYSEGAVYASMSGSGSALYGIFRR